MLWMSLSLVVPLWELLCVRLHNWCEQLFEILNILCDTGQDDLKKTTRARSQTNGGTQKNATTTFISSAAVAIHLWFYYQMYIYRFSLQLKIRYYTIPCISLRPNCPALFLPQPNTAPDKERAKLWSPPAMIFARGIPARDLRSWGNNLLGSPFPRPSWPLLFWPHVKSWPSKRERETT